jgi:endonuclease/exonuclease/phosphatase family metal-dependent hydrolase
VLSYNILYGAGVERQFDSALPAEMVGKSRLPDLLSFIRDVNPDIIGLQEANGWERGTPPTIQQVAQQLGMNQFLARTAGGFHLGLLTKFTILEAENLSSEMGRQGALRATLLSPTGERLYVFVVHLDPASSNARLCEVNTLLRLMQPYANSSTILFGDMNFRSLSPEYARLEQAAWKPVAIEPGWGIDQIWVSSSLNLTYSSWFETLSTSPAISDHKPIGAEINVFFPRAVPSITPTLRAAVTATAAPTPIFAADALTGVRVLRQERFDDPCVMTKWNLGIAQAKFSNAMLEVNGLEAWQSLVSRHREFVEGEGVILRFQPERDPEFELYFDNSGWNGDQYRRFGINVRGKVVRAILWQGNSSVRGENLTENPMLQSGGWYTLLLAVGKGGDLIARLWDPADPTTNYQFRDKLGEMRTELPWVFGIAANKGTVSIDSFAEIAFDEIK